MRGVELACFDLIAVVGDECHGRNNRDFEISTQYCDSLTKMIMRNCLALCMLSLFRHFWHNFDRRLRSDERRDFCLRTRLLLAGNRNLAWLPNYLKMADDSLNYVEDTFHDLEEEDESSEWTEIFSVPNMEWRSLGSNTWNGIESEENSNTKDINQEVGQDKVIVEKDEKKTTESSKGLTRMELNDHKAGMVGLDKEKINQIIFETSKGSRFYENELKKDKQVAERIRKQTACLEKITEQQRQEALQTTQLIVNEFEKTRDLSRTFVHIDMDAFYAAVEILDNPELRDKPMAVGSNAMLSTSNYPARRYGVRAAMPGFIAKKLCPELVIVPPHFEKYKEYSRQVQEILTEFDPNFAMASLDEAYLDLTEYLRERQENKEKRTFTSSKGHSESRPGIETEKDHEMMASEVVEFGNDAEEVVRELRFRIERKTRLTASAGIAPNVLLAKVCSDRNKPNGQFFLKPDYKVVLEFVHKLPIRKISGIGRVSEQMLKALGIETCKDLYTKRDLLYLLHSPISFRFLIQVSLGIGNTSIVTDSKRKSIGTETTFPEMSKPEELLDMCDKLCQLLAEDLKKQKLKGKTVTIKLKTVNFEVKSRSLSPLNPVSTYEEISQAAEELLKNEISACSPDPLRLRLMGVRLSNFQDNCISDSSKDGRQNTITEFLKPKKNVPHLKTADYFTPTHEFTTEEVSIAGQSADKNFSNELGLVVQPSDFLRTDKKDSFMSSTSSITEPNTSSKSNEVKNCVVTCNPSALLCPVCGQEQLINPSEDAMIELNKHIDLCLNKATIREIVSRNNSGAVNNTCSSDNGRSTEATSYRGKRKREQSGTVSKKATLHSFWSKNNLS